MRHSPFTAVYDACVLYPAPLRDLLVRLAGKGLYRAKWTAQIDEEWKRNLLKDFPPAALAPFDVEAQHPDEFIMDLWDLDQAAVLAAATEMRRALTRSPYTPEEFIECIFKQGLPQTANALRSYTTLI